MRHYANGLFLEGQRFHLYEPSNTLSTALTAGSWVTLSVVSLAGHDPVSALIKISTYQTQILETKKSHRIHLRETGSGISADVKNLIGANSDTEDPTADNLYCVGMGFVLLNNGQFDYRIDIEASQALDTVWVTEVGYFY